MFEMVPAARIRELIAHEIQSTVEGMEFVRDGVWARSLGGGVRAVVEIQGIKGGQYDVIYGICCDWVPKIARSNRLGRFPRTVKQTALHLWIDHFTIDAPERPWISSLNGERVARSQATAAASHLAAHAPKWWSAVTSPAGVLTEARRQMAADYDIHFPRARLVTAFTLARLGHVDAARTELALAGDDEVLLPALDDAVAMSR